MPREYSYTKDQLSLRSTIPMTPELRQQLEALCAKCKERGGKKVAASAMVRSLISALVKLQNQIDWQSIRNEEQLLEKLIAGLSKKK